MLNVLTWGTICIFINIVTTIRVGYDDDLDGWKQRWFPYHPIQGIDNNPTVDYGPSDQVHVPKYEVRMGSGDTECDDGHHRLETDWPGSPENYTCFKDKHLFLPNANVHALVHRDHIPPMYVAEHKCMNTSIDYPDQIPTFGAHRPLWAMYGEYTFLPKQRWIHNLEHGAVVMLYHPCANKREVNKLRKLVTSCLYRHVITPYALLPMERPLALVVWGCRFLMSMVAPELVTEFIKSEALKGPEQTSREGQYNYQLLNGAKIVTDAEDSILCPHQQIHERA